MTNTGVVGFPTGLSGGIRDGSITPEKLGTSLTGKFISGRYYFPVGGSSTGLTTANTCGVGTLRVCPWIVPTAVSITVLGGEVSSAGEGGSKVRLGIYADNGSGYPGNLLLDAGTIAGDSNTVQDIAVWLTLTPGLYWLGGAVQVVSATQPTVRVTTVPLPFPVAMGTTAPAGGTSTSGYSQTSVTGAFPSVFSSTVATSGLVPRLHVKVA